MTDSEYLQQSVMRGLEEILVSEKSMSLPQAMELLRKSKTFALLMDVHTCLYRESPSYVYELLMDEQGWR